MPEENNNQPATPPINYEEHLDWFRVFVFIILPIQFIIELNAFYENIRDFNEIIGINNYINVYAFIIFLFQIITFISIIIVFISSIKKKPIGYKVIWFYSISLIIYEILTSILEYFFILDVHQINSAYLAGRVFGTFVYIAIAIINLIYFSHRKFLFGIPDEKSIPPESKEEE